MHRLLTRRDLYCYLAIPLVIYLTSFAVSALDNPSPTKPAALPTKTVTQAPIKPTLPQPTEQVTLPIPLSDELVAVLVTACEEYDVPLALAVAVMEQESGFEVDAVGWDGHDIGLMQLRDTYHWWLTEQTGADPMEPEGNIRCGVWLLGYHLGRQDTAEAALTAYRWGHDNGERGYAEEVVGRMEEWGNRVRAIKSAANEWIRLVSGKET